MIKFFKKVYYNYYGRIECAALLKDGVIYTGNNHAECFKRASKGYLVDATQGFLTENNKFVDRKLGLKLANYYNQIKVKHPPYDELLSEDYL